MRRERKKREERRIANVSRETIMRRERKKREEKRIANVSRETI